jgi:hypothetical protein
VKTTLFVVIALAIAGRSGAEEASLAERAQAANKNREKKADAGRVLTNEDLKKAKGNVIFLQSTPTPASAVTVDVPVQPAAVAVVEGDIVRQLDEHRGRAARLRGVVEEAQRELAVSTADTRPVIEQRLRDTLDELARTHEMIGTLSERMRQGVGAAPPSSEPVS